MGSTTLLDLNYTDEMSILDENVSKMNEVLEVSPVHGTRIALEINDKKTKSPRLGIGEGEEMTLDNEKINQVDSSLTLTALLVKTVDPMKMLK